MSGGWLLVALMPLRPGAMPDPAALTPAERAHAAALPCGPRRAGYVAARGLLRRLLAELGEPRLARAELVASATGKPRLPGPAPGIGLSHAPGLVAVALAAEPVGLDVEAERALAPGLLARLPPAGPVRWIAAPGALAAPDTAAPLRRWTLAEARVKLAGGRLAEALAPWAGPPRPVAALAPDLPAGHLCTCCMGAPPDRVEIRLLSPA